MTHKTAESTFKLPASARFDEVSFAISHGRIRDRVSMRLEDSASNAGRHAAEGCTGTGATVWLKHALQKSPILVRGLVSAQGIAIGLYPR